MLEEDIWHLRGVHFLADLFPLFFAPDFLAPPFFPPAFLLVVVFLVTEAFWGDAAGLPWGCPAAEPLEALEPPALFLMAFDLPPLLDLFDFDVFFAGALAKKCYVNDVPQWLIHVSNPCRQLSSLPFLPLNLSLNEDFKNKARAVVG